MPGKDGTGPLGQGPVVGRGTGFGGRSGMGGGPVGYCICPNCGKKINHTAGVPCTSRKCPNCGVAMVRGI